MYKFSNKDNKFTVSDKMLRKNDRFVSRLQLIKKKNQD